jgi:hypothetical protein
LSPTEYALPVVNSELAAHVASYSEHLFPSLLARELPTSATGELTRDKLLDNITSLGTAAALL